MTRFAPLLAASALAAATPQDGDPPPDTEYPDQGWDGADEIDDGWDDAAEGDGSTEKAPDIPDATIVRDPAALARLRGNSGVTLQWIGWEQRGVANVGGEALITLTPRQRSADGVGELSLDGVVTEIGADYFIFLGRIEILDTPDRGRTCDRAGRWRFAITENRKYWRLREFEWCDDLTDYIDIYC